VLQPQLVAAHQHVGRALAVRRHHARVRGVEPLRRALQLGGTSGTSETPRCRRIVAGSIHACGVDVLERVVQRHRVLLDVQLRGVGGGRVGEQKRLVQLLAPALGALVCAALRVARRGERGGVGGARLVGAVARVASA
jgi:hypothetical protein